MAVETVINLVDALRQFRLLEADQLEVVLRELAVRFPEPKGLAKELLQRGWLTPYQVNQIFLGRGQELVLGGYVLLDRLGEGGMGQVFRARQVSMGRVVALKLIRKERLRSEQAARRFQREILAAAKLEHANVVRAFDAGQAGETHFFAMEFVDGIDLGKCVKSRGPLPVQEACDFIRQAALGLQHAFEHKMIHRDLKPANLLVTNEPRVVKILDMGLVLEERGSSEDSNSSTLTQENVVMGTPDYLAPEQARDAHSVDIRADIYSLGCTLYFLLAGRVPFPGGQLGEKLLKHQLEQAPPLSRFRADVPGEVEELVQRLMAKKPEDRYQTPQELADALQCLLSGERPLRPATLAGVPAKPGTGENPFVDLGGETHPGSDTSPSRKMPAAERRSLPRTVRTAASTVTKIVVPPFRWLTELLKPVAEKAGIPREKTSYVVLGITGICMLSFVGCLLVGRSDKGTPEKRPPLEAKKQPGSHLDLLDANLIPPAQRPKWLPREVVAVLGERPVPSKDKKATKPVGHRGEVAALALSGDGKLLATGGGSQDRNVFLWSLEGPQPKLLRDINTGTNINIHVLAFSPDGKYLAGAGRQSPYILLWDLGKKDFDNPGVLRGYNVKAHAAGVSSLAFTPDSKTLISGGHPEICTWDLRQGLPKDPADVQAKHVQPKQGTAWITGLAFRPDGKAFVSGGQDAQIGVWDMSRGSSLFKAMIPKTHSITRLSYYPDGQTILSGGQDRLLRCWDVRDFQEKKDSFPIQAAVITAVSFNPQRPQLVTGDRAGNLRAWDLHSTHVTTWQLETPITDAAFAPDGRHVAVATGAGIVLVLRLANPSE